MHLYMHRYGPVLHIDGWCHRGQAAGTAGALAARAVLFPHIWADEYRRRAGECPCIGKTGLAVNAFVVVLSATGFV